MTTSVFSHLVPILGEMYFKIEKVDVYNAMVTWARTHTLNTHFSFDLILEWNAPLSLTFKVGSQLLFPHSSTYSWIDIHFLSSQKKMCLLENPLYKDNDFSEHIHRIQMVYSFIITWLKTFKSLQASLTNALPLTLTLMKLWSVSEQDLYKARSWKGLD